LQLLGFPVQLIGVLSLPYLYVKYGIEGGNFVDDVGNAAVSSVPLLKMLPDSNTISQLPSFVFMLALLLSA
jgi:hypothetical protein